MYIRHVYVYVYIYIHSLQLTTLFQAAQRWDDFLDKVPSNKGPSPLREAYAKARCFARALHKHSLGFRV